MPIFVLMNVMKSIGLPSVIWPSWTKDVAGDTFTDLTAIAEWSNYGSNLSIAQNHPIATPAILFVSKVFSQAEFSLKRKSTDKFVFDNPILDLLDNPNPYQTRQDFLETLMFMQIAQGVAVVWKQVILGFTTPKALWVLDKTKIKWPEQIKKGLYRYWDNRVKNMYVIYDEFGENLRIQIKDLLFFYDLPNHVNKNPFEVKSRLDGLKQTLINTQDSLIAKNIILKSNGKEMITTKGNSKFPLEDTEKTRIESMWNNTFGLAFNRKRGFATRADLEWKSLHIALRDLGLDESVKVDGNLIYTALHIPKDILSLEAKKTTYNNFKESMVSYVQNEIQATLNSFIAVLQKEVVNSNYKLIGNYEHMPIMQFILIERYDGIKKKAEALNALLRTGIPEETALEMCGFEKGLKLNPLMQLENGQQQQNNGTSSNGNQEDTDE